MKNFKPNPSHYLKSLFLLVISLFLLFPHLAQLKTVESVENLGPRSKIAISSYFDGPTLPEIPVRPARKTMIITVSAYNSLPEQTDDTPFITAFGTQTRDGIIATNFLPQGTLVRFPEVFGDKEFVVEDRMNERYYYRVDIWMEHKVDAKQFGVKALKMEIL